MPRAVVSEDDSRYLLNFLQCVYRLVTDSSARELSEASDLTILAKLHHLDSVILSDFPVEFFAQNPAIVQVVSSIQLPICYRSSYLS